MKKPVIKILILFALYKCGYKAGADNTLYQIKNRAIALTVNPAQTNNALLTPTFQYVLYGADKKEKYLNEIKKISSNDSLMMYYKNMPTADRLLKKIKH